MEKILQFKDVGLTYQAPTREVEALKQLNFSVHKEELVAIVGPSGCGKTSILSMIAGLAAPTSGEILTQKDELEVGYMLQQDSLLAWRSVYDNTLFGLEIAKKLTDSSISRVERLLDTYGLSDFKDAYPTELSGGMRQCVALIRTLAIKPDILLLDEAFSALDYQTRLIVQSDVHQILKKEATPALIVTHDLTEAISMADKIIVLSQRPGTVESVMDLSFDAHLTPGERRRDPLFQTYFSELWQYFGGESDGA